MGNAPGIRGIRNGSLLRSCCKNEFKEPKKFVHVRASDDERRQQAQRKIVGAIDEQTAPHGLADERGAFDGKFDADHQAFTANFADEAKFCRELYEAVAQLRTAQASGPPPKVVPCIPGETREATSSVVRMAPSGSPAARGLAIKTMSGLEENF